MDIKNKKLFGELKSSIDFKCRWCGHEFKHKEPDTSGSSRKDRVADQIVCPRCNNFLKSNGGM